MKIFGFYISRKPWQDKYEALKADYLSALEEIQMLKLENTQYRSRNVMLEHKVTLNNAGRGIGADVKPVEDDGIVAASAVMISKQTRTPYTKSFKDEVTVDAGMTTINSVSINDRSHSADPLLSMLGIKLMNDMEAAKTKDNDNTTEFSWSKPDSSRGTEITELPKSSADSYSSRDVGSSDSNSFSGGSSDSFSSSSDSFSSSGGFD